MKYISKWQSVGIDKVKRRKLYDKNRLIANTILRNRHKKEYNTILNKLMYREYFSRLKELKGGLN